MNRRTPAVLLAGILVAAIAAMAIPVTPTPDRDGAADGIEAGWSHISRSNGEVADIWWTVWGPCSPNFLGERLICNAVDGSAARSREFEVAANETWGLLVETHGVLLPVHLC
jgi:hypothetical protein